MLAWGLMLTGAENVLRPMLISGRARISALAIFIGRFGRDSGVRRNRHRLGPVVISLTLALIEFAEEPAEMRTRP